MKVIGDFNKVSDKLKEELIPKLPEKGTVSFQLLDGQLDVGSKRIVFGNTRAIRLSDRIYDPYAIDKGNGEYEGKYVDIGVPKTYDQSGRFVSCGKKYVKALVSGVPGNGTFTFHAGNIKDMEEFEFLCLCNENEDNPYRDTSIPAKFKMIDARKEAKVKLSNANTLSDALLAARQMDSDKLAIFCDSMNWHENDPFVLQAKVLEYATNHPKEFKDHIGEGSPMLILSQIKRALDVEVIRYDSMEHRIVWAESDATLAKLDRVEGKSHIQLFCDWVQKSANGKNTLIALTKRYNAKIKESEPTTT